MLTRASIRVYTRFVVKTDCYCTSIRAATRRISALYDAALEPIGVNVAQWGLLRKLDASPGRSFSIGELAARVELERSTVSRNVRVLARLGLVELSESLEDRRASTIALSRRGLVAIEQGAPLWEDAQRQFEQMLGIERATQLRSVLLSV